MNSSFSLFRERYPVFSYNGYSVEKTNGEIVLSFDFSIPELCEFHPATRIKTDNLNILNDPASPYAKRMIFFLGLAEAVSYWKCSCPPVFEVKCGSLSEDDIAFWKKLWFNGLGEFFYRNSIDTTLESFVEIKAEMSSQPTVCENYRQSGIEIIPVGGGKDSAVTTELLKSGGGDLRFFTVNDQPARTACVEAAGFSADKIIKTYRTIDRELLNRNAEGFLNGHTPFSSVVAFLSMYCGYLLGAEDIILSNESSANDSNLDGLNINHQYSKSFEFESDFNVFRRRSFPQSAEYFSLLRPFNELQIAKMFSSLPQYHAVFRSCNAGSKKNIWCASCAKCLFVAIILSPFLSPEKLNKIFSCDMLDKAELTDDFDGLCGFVSLKPFECVGTAEEVRCALAMTAEKYRAQKRPMPYLLSRFAEKYDGCADTELLKELNGEHLIPEKFSACIERMYKYVSAAC